MSLLTNDLISDYTGENAVLPEIMAAGLTRVEAIAQMASFVSSTYFDSFESPGYRSQCLSELHQDLRQECADRFWDYSAAYPDLTKEEINGLDEMVVLHGLRRGVHQAMVQSYRSKSPSARGNWVFDFEVAS